MHAPDVVLHVELLPVQFPTVGTLEAWWFSTIILAVGVHGATCAIALVAGRARMTFLRQFLHEPGELLTPAMNLVLLWVDSVRHVRVVWK